MKPFSRVTAWATAGALLLCYPLSYALLSKFGRYELAWVSGSVGHYGWIPKGFETPDLKSGSVMLDSVFSPLLGLDWEHWHRPAIQADALEYNRTGHFLE